MYGINYFAAELSLLCKEYKDAANENNGIKAEKLVEQIQEIIEKISPESPHVNCDSLFFAGELNSNIGETEVQYPEHVSAWQKRREERRKKKRQDDDDSESGEAPAKGGHGNTKLPFGLCERYGIAVQSGWTPREAWEALAGKGVSAKEEYKKLRERGRAEKAKQAPQKQSSAFSMEEHEKRTLAYQQKRTEIPERLKQLKVQMIASRDEDAQTYRKKIQAESDLSNAQRKLDEAKDRKERIAGRTEEQIRSEYEKAVEDYDRIYKINEKYYQRPDRKSPERKEWDEWCDSLGGRAAVSEMINKAYEPGGAFSAKSELKQALDDISKYGEDGGYKEANKKVRSLQRTIKKCEDAFAQNEEKFKALEAEQESAISELKEAHKQYAESVRQRFPTFDDCKTVEDVAERLSAEELFTGTELDCDFGTAITRETAIEVSKDLVAYAEKVPFLKGNCHRLAFRNLTGERFGGVDYSNVYGYSDSSKEVVLNEKYYRDYEQTKAKYVHDLESSFHPEGTTFNSVVHHEYSHQLDDFMSKKMGLEHGGFSSEIIKSVCEELKISESECKAAVSGYSVNNRSGGAVEWFAEAMSEYTSSKSPRPIAVACGNAVMKKAKELGLIHGDAVEEYRIRRKKRLDARAEDEEGRWVTTENDNRVHINEEGVPDKGNPYVLAAMRGEGPNPKSREELTRHRLQRAASKNRALYSALTDAEKERSKAEREWAAAKTEYRRTSMKKRVTDNERQQIQQRGYGEGDKDRMKRDIEDLEVEMESFLHGRDKWNLEGDEKKAYDEIEGKRNILQYHLGYFDDCFGPDAVTDDTVREAEEKLKAAEERQAKAEKAVEQAKRNIKNATGSPDSERFLTNAERNETISAITSSKMWGEMSDAGRSKAMESLQNVSDAHLLLLQKTLGNAKIHDSHGRISDSGGASWYMNGTGSITLAPEDMERPQVLWHEFGHYLDDSKASGCNMGHVDLAGYTYQEDLSNVLGKKQAMHNAAVAQDLQRLFDEVSPGELDFDTWDTGVLRIKHKDGGYVDDKWDSAYSTITDKIGNLFHEFEYHSDEEYNEYCKSIGYPPDWEDPKYSDYVEYYRTPKRGLLREREKYKGARNEYYKQLRAAQDARSKALEEHPEYYDKYKEYQKRCDQRSEMVAPVSDILCGIFRGNGPWIYGGHSADYYSRSDSPYKEAVANYHQMRMMGWTDGLELLRSLVPSVHDELESAYNEFLWRNVDL